MTKLSKKRIEEIKKQFGGKIPTKEELMQKIIESQQRMVDALEGAYKNAPNDPKIKEEILTAVEKSVKLKKNIVDAFSDKKEK